VHCHVRLGQFAALATGYPLAPGSQPMLRKPYLLFLGDISDASSAKTAFGLKDWCGSDVIGQLRLPGCAVDLEIPDLTSEEAVRRGAGSLVIGVANFGGVIPESWFPSLRSAVDAGLDIVSGAHRRLEDVPGLADAAAARGVALHNVRHSNQSFDVATGRKRSGLRLLNVGTDCALGKKYTALAIAQGLNDAGVAATFRATGQTGIMISGEGVAIDAVVADFLAGAAEALSPDNFDQHWDVIEGQGALFHPAYAAVTLGLIHGSQPDAIVLCHDPLRDTIYGYPDYPLPDLATAIEHYLLAGRLTNGDIRCVGISLNTSKMTQKQADQLCADYSSRLGLPAFDPVRHGVTGLIERLRKDFDVGAVQ
jgi:uncharacterized NAD-dependent epimerase/dehydratase family protein